MKAVGDYTLEVCMLWIQTEVFRECRVLRGLKAFGVEQIGVGRIKAAQGFTPTYKRPLLVS